MHRFLGLLLFALTLAAPGAHAQLTPPSGGASCGGSGQPVCPAPAIAGLILTPNGQTFSAGAGTPSGPAPAGSLYLSAGAIYQYVSGSWVAVGGGGSGEWSAGTVTSLSSDFTLAGGLLSINSAVPSAGVPCSNGSVVAPCTLSGLTYNSGTNTLTATAGVAGPATTTVGYVPQWSVTNGETLGVGLPVGSGSGLAPLSGGVVPVANLPTITSSVCEGWPSDTTVTAATFVLPTPAAWTGTNTIQRVDTRTDGSGSPGFTVGIQLGGTGVTGCTAIAVSGTTTTTTTCTATTYTGSAQIGIVVSSPTGTPNTASVCVEIEHAVQ